MSDLHFAAFEGPRAAADKAEFDRFLKLARQGDPHADASLRLTALQWLACEAVIPDYVRRWLFDAVSKMPMPKPPNRPNQQLRRQNIIEWIRVAIFMRNAARLSGAVNAWAATQPGQLTSAKSDEDIFQACGQAFSVSAKTCKNIYLTSRTSGEA